MGVAAADVGPAGVDGQHGYAACDAAGGAGEGARVAERLQVQQGEVGAVVGLPPLEHVVAADVVLVAEGDEGRHPDAEPGQAVEQRDAHAAGLHGDSGRSGARVGGGEGGVEAHLWLGVGDAEAVGADEPHAVGAAGGQQGLCLGVVEARGDDDEGAGPGPAALLGDGGDRGGRYGHHDEVGRLRQCRDRRIGRHPEHRGDTGVHGEEAAGETARVQGVQDGPPDRSGCASGPDHRDHGGPQQGQQAGHAGGAAAGLDGGQVGVVLVEVDGAAHLRPLETAGGAQAEVGEEPEHLVVLAERVGGEGGDALVARRRDEVLDQQGAHAPVVQAVGDGDGDLRALPLPAGVVLGEADHAAVDLGQQGPVARVGGGAGPVGGQVGRAAAGREEPQPEVLRRHLLVEPSQLAVVAGHGRPDADGGAVREQGVDRGPLEQVVRHRRSPHGFVLRSSGGAREEPMGCPGSARGRSAQRPPPSGPASAVRWPRTRQSSATRAVRSRRRLV